MELLKTALADITTLLATRRALASPRVGQMEDGQHQLRSKLRRQIRRGALAYTEALARARPRPLDEALLCVCRLAAEQQMPAALAQQPMLRHIMASEAGSIDRLAAVRQDLWRLAQMAICLGLGLAALRKSSAGAEVALAETLAARLRRRLHRALLAYARAALRTEAHEGRLVARARADALATLGPAGATQAERLADVEADANAALSLLRLGVAKPLLTLALDWQRPHVVPDEQLVRMSIDRDRPLAQPVA